MSDILKDLESYPDDPTVVMSQRLVGDVVAEIKRLRAELVAEQERTERAENLLHLQRWRCLGLSHDLEEACEALKKIAARDVPFPETNMEGYASMAVVTARETLSRIKVKDNE